MLSEALAEPAECTWGAKATIEMTNVFFAGTLPKLLGFDYGPVELEGSRGSVVQCAVYRSGGRQTSFAPSWRYVTDMGQPEVHTVLPGGPSGRRTSSLYTEGIEDWLAYRYKTLSLHE